VSAGATRQLSGRPGPRARQGLIEAESDPQFDIREFHGREARAEETAREFLDLALVAFGQLDHRHEDPFGGEKLSSTCLAARRTEPLQTGSCAVTPLSNPVGVMGLVRPWGRGNVVDRSLSIGTGRVALPLAARGIRVDGVDISPAMVAKLLDRPRITAQCCRGPFFRIGD